MITLGKARARSLTGGGSQTAFLSLALLWFLLCGCGQYADFTLPPLEKQRGIVRWSWKVNESPVMSNGPAGSWDTVATLNPSVVRVGGQYVNLYSGFDGRTWHTGRATSTDGIQWSRRDRILSPDGWEGGYIAANGSALVIDGRWFYWYQGGLTPRIGLIVSDDGRNWTVHDRNPVLSIGPRGSWDERGVADPYVIRVHSTFYMYYLGQDRAHRQRLGVARSGDGVRWERLRSNPVLELGASGAFDETGVGEPAVWQDLGSWWMLYTARDRREVRRLGLARSQDGVNWERVTKRPVFEGTLPWNSMVVCDPTVLPAGTGAVHVWFGGGERAEPAENLHGQIGYARLQLIVGGRS
jgi:predicted GH43/DUF377 family glycosyl hydrolase